MNVDLGRVRTQIQTMVNTLIESIPNLIVGLVVLTIFLLLARIAKNFAIRTGKRYGHSVNLGLVTGRLIQWAVGLTGVLVAISVVAPSFQAKDLISMLGIGGLAVGFAFKDIFQNFLAGIILLVTHPFEIDDQISAGGFEGRVESIETRATTIRTYDDRRVVIPNATLFTEPLRVDTAFGQIQSEYEIHLKNGIDFNEARERLQKAIAAIAEVLHDPQPEVLLNGLGDDNVTLLARWWTAPRYSGSVYVRHKVLLAIRESLSPVAPHPAIAGQ